jgi:NADH:ubiquinone oxidoreductase subunit 4 (subunit M)
MNLRHVINRRLRAPVLLALAAAATALPTASAFVFEFGEFQGSFDTTSRIPSVTTTASAPAACSARATPMMAT